MKLKAHLVAFFLLSLTTTITVAASDAQQYWPQWRGPEANGVAPLADPPLTWSDSKNVKWKVAIPGFGTSTPIIWENQVFILTAVPTGKKSGKKPAESAPANGQKAQPGMLAEMTDEIYQFV